MHQKSNPRYTRDITLKRVTSGGAHYRGLVLGKTAPKKKYTYIYAAVANLWRHQLVSSVVKLIAIGPGDQWFDSLAGEIGYNAYSMVH